MQRMTKDEARKVLYGDGSTRHSVYDRLRAHERYLRAPGYNSMSAQASHHGEVLADIAEALCIIMEKS